jgi:hypothetical protein
MEEMFSIWYVLALHKELNSKLQNSNCLKEKLKQKAKLVAGPRRAPDNKTDWSTDRRS